MFSKYLKYIDFHSGFENMSLENFIKGWGKAKLFVLYL
jgi:hypothetical protein